MEDILGIIFGWVDTGSAYKAIIFTCRQWQRVMTTRFPRKYLELSNHTRTLLKLFPDAPWSWVGLSFNPNITWEFIHDNPKITCDRHHALSRRPDITQEIIQKYPEISWDWDGLSLNPNITWETVQANPASPWNWKGLSANRHSRSFCCHN